MSLNKRIRKKTVGKMSNQKEYPTITMEQAIDLVIAGKSAEGLRERTLRDYRKDWGYFVSWLQKNYEIETVDELTPQIFRDYINYLKYDAPKYDGHKFIQSDQGIGLSETTINIRLRVYRVNKRLKYYGAKAGIEGKKVTAHVYRHTWAKNMTLNGCDAFTLQKMGGWSDIRTMRRYIQMDTDDLRKSHDSFSPVMKMVTKKR
jgi:site-specific recombinase XerD